MADSDSANNKDIIEAVDVSSVHQATSTTPTGSSQKLQTKTWLWFGFFVLLILALYVIFLLPRTVEYKLQSNSSDNQSPPSPISEPKPVTAPAIPEPVETAPQLPQTTPVDDAAQQQAKTQAEELLTRIIELEALLNKHAVNKWAAEEFAQATEQGRIGDEYFRRKQFLQATESFQSAISKLEDLQNRIEATLEQALSRGEQALTQGDQATALQQFELAKAIAPDDTRASNGLQRATTIEQLFALLQRGSSFESHGQLTQAQSTYQEAVALDPLSNEAKSALARVDKKIADNEFKQLIATAYQALQNGQYADARAAFNAAKKLNPKSKEPAIGLQKVAAAIRDEKIASLLFEAEHFEQLQQWQQAATSYEKILQLSSTHAVAQQGLIESTQKAKILKDLLLALDFAEQLHKEKILKQAELVLASAEKLTSPGSIIEQHSEQLHQLVRVATTPIPIIIESDNNTEIIVYKVARLGTVNRHELQLRPGPYTIVGTRTGFRDVRKTIQVTPESRNLTLAIFCTEPI